MSMGVSMQNFPSNEICLIEGPYIVMHSLSQEGHNKSTNKKKNALYNLRGNIRMQVYLSFIYINSNIYLLYICD